MCLKSLDLLVARVKRGESRVEVRNGPDVQIGQMSYESKEKPNLEREWLVPPEGPRRDAAIEIVPVVEL